MIGMAGCLSIRTPTLLHHLPLRPLLAGCGPFPVFDGPATIHHYMRAADSAYALLHRKLQGRITAPGSVDAPSGGSAGARTACFTGIDLTAGAL